MRADCGASAGRWVCLGWGFRSAERPWVFLHRQPLPLASSSCSAPFLACLRELFWGVLGFLFLLVSSLEFPLGMGYFVMPTMKTSASWSVKYSESHAYWDKTKAVLCPKLPAQVAMEAQCPGFQPFRAQGLVIMWKSLCEEKQREGLVWVKGGGRQWGGRGRLPLAHAGIPGFQPILSSWDFMRCFS